MVFSTLPSSCSSSHSSLYKGYLSPCIDTLNLIIVKKICKSDFVRLESSHSGSYLECVSTSSEDSFITHLGVPSSPSGVTTFFFHKLSSFLHHFYSFLAPLSIPYISFSTFLLVFVFVLFFICFLSLIPHHCIIHTI